MIRECLKIIGTAHVSQNSADEVRAAILEDQPDVVAIELDRGRYQRLMNERNGIVEDDSIHICFPSYNNPFLYAKQDW